MWSANEEELSLYITFWSAIWHKNVSGRAAALQMTEWGALGNPMKLPIFSVPLISCMQGGSTCTRLFYVCCQCGAKASRRKHVANSLWFVPRFLMRVPEFGQARLSNSFLYYRSYLGLCPPDDLRRYRKIIVITLCYKALVDVGCWPHCLRLSRPVVTL
jgi:hypothetical protein